MTTRRSPSSVLAQYGVATLVAGVVAGIAPGCLTAPANCTILLSRNTPGGTLGFLAAPVADRGAASTTFSIGSTSNADTSTVNWLAIPKQPGNASTTFYNDASLRRSPSGLNVITGMTTLVAGTKTVTGVPMGPNARVFVMAATRAGTAGKLSVPQATVLPASGSFVINSDNAADVSTVTWVVVDNPIRFSPSGIVFSQSFGPMTAGLATFFEMDQTSTNQTQADAMAVLASFINTSSPGNLGAPTGGLRAGGQINVNSSSGTDASTIEVAAF